MIFLKKLISSVLFLCFLLFVNAESTIPEDFYINNGRILPKGSILAENVLPNALRVCICEGESYELYADILPENTTEKKLVWKIFEGEKIISISTRNNRCTLFGKKSGNARLSVTAPGGAGAEISIEIKPAPKETTEITEYNIPEREKPEESEGKVAKLFSLILIILSGGMFITAALLWRGGRKNEKR